MNKSDEEMLARAIQLGTSAEIVVLPARLRVVKQADLDSAPGQVFVDATTFLAAARVLRIVSAVGIEEAQRRCNAAELGGALSLLQCLVLHERVWVDALSLARSEEAAQFAALWSPLVSAVIVEKATYQGAWKEVLQLQASTFEKSIPDVDAKLSWAEGVDRPYHHPSDVINPPSDARQSNLLFLTYDDRGSSQTVAMCDVPAPLADSNSGVARTIFYLNLSTKLSRPYVPHPDRAALISRMFASRKLARSEAVEVVNELDREIMQGDDFDVSFPPVASLVLELCKKHEGDWLPAVSECRTRARDFRAWCAELEGATRSGRIGKNAKQRLRAELEVVKKEWKADLNEEVRYKTYLVSLPWLEKWIKVTGVTSDRKTKSPILWGRNKPLVFLNSLYSEFTGSPARTHR